MTSSVSVVDVSKSAGTRRPYDPLWTEISDAILDFKCLAALASRTSINRPDGKVPSHVEKALLTSLDRVMELLRTRLGPLDQSDAHQREIGKRVHAELLPFALLGRFSNRAYAKPLGYAGDFETISMVYENEPCGVGALGTLVDRYFMSFPPAVAVRNRRPLMVAELTKQLDIAVAEGRGLRVTSLACGPACEIVDLFESGRNVDAIHATLLDADPRALAAFYGKISRAPYRGQIQLVHGNLLELGELRCRANLRDQDVVFSLGLVDYFADAFVVDLLDYVYEVLRPGGQIILGNFHVRNQYRGLLDYVLDWVLIHRTEDDMKRLFAESRFRLCCDIFFEDQGINMFARAVKPPS